MSVAMALRERVLISSRRRYGRYLGARGLDQAVVFIDFEYIFGAAVVLVLLLMYLFYVKYPYDKDLE